MKQVLIIICLVVFMFTVSGCPKESSERFSGFEAFEPEYVENLVESNLSQKPKLSERLRDEEGRYLLSRYLQPPPWVNEKKRNGKTNNEYWLDQIRYTNFLAHQWAKEKYGTMQEWREETAEKQRRVVRD